MELSGQPLESQPTAFHEAPRIQCQASRALFKLTATTAHARRRAGLQLTAQRGEGIHEVGGERAEGGFQCRRVVIAFLEAGGLAQLP